MKNQILLMAVAAMAFASCSKDEMTEVNPGNEIGFRTAVTRATEMTTSLLSEMKVTALYTDAEAATSTYFDAVTFDDTDANDTWESQGGTYYWPTAGTMSFYAWSPVSLSPTISSTSKTLAFTPETAVASQVDFIAAKLEGVDCSATTGTQNLPFTHALSQIIIKAKNSNAGYVYKVYGVRIGKVATSGTYDFAAGTWDTNSAAKGNYEVTYDSNPVTLATSEKSIMDGEGEGVTATNNAAMLVPQTTTEWNKQPEATSTGSYISVKVQITTPTGFQVFPSAAGSSDWVAVPVAFTWANGNKYTYVLDFSNGAGQVDPSNPDQGGDDVLGGAIDFSVSVAEWGNTENSTPVNM